MLDTISMAEKLRGDYRKVFEKAGRCISFLCDNH